MNSRSLVLPLLAGIAGCGIIGGGTYRGAVAASDEADLVRFQNEVLLERRDRDPDWISSQAGASVISPWMPRDVASVELDRALFEGELQRLRERFDDDDLDENGRLDLELLRFDCERGLARLDWWDYGYLLLPGEAPHTRAMADLLASPPIQNRAGMDRYMRQVTSTGRVIEATAETLLRRASVGRNEPRTALEHAAAELEGLLGASWELSADPSEESIFLRDLRHRLRAATWLEDSNRAVLLDRAQEKLEQDLERPLNRLLATIDDLSQDAVDAGIWRLPRGVDYYQHLVEHATSSDVTASEMHDMGLREVARIRGEMEPTLIDIGHVGNLQSFFTRIHDEDHHYEAQNEQGRASLLASAERFTSEARERAREWVPKVPGLPLVVQLLGGDGPPAGYHPGDIKSGRSAYWVIDASDMRELPRFMIMTRAHLYGYPGRHLREAITQERAGLTQLRRVRSIPTWSEGWDLYATWLATRGSTDVEALEVFGALAAELWAAARSVADTALHHEQRTKEEVRHWLRENTLATPAQCDRALDDLLLRPGSALAASFGGNQLREWRSRGQELLGIAFDQRAFHSIVLGAGPLPPRLLSGRIRSWLEGRE